MANTAAAGEDIGAIILGAGMSRRMGQPKLLLPWGDSSVIERIVQVLANAGIQKISLVSGAEREKIEAALAGLAVETLYNPEYATSEMLASLKLGLQAQPAQLQAVLVVLGDQPGIEGEVVSAVAQRFRQSQARLVVPSYKHRRGHPWLVRRDLWPELLELDPSLTLRDFLNQHGEEIDYVDVSSASVLKDIDTPQDYLKEKPVTSSPPE
jgi:molybdenum cofactor cytidylyltransferase